MSNNRNRNRRPRTEITGFEVRSERPQDKPFVYQSKNGLIKIPSGIAFDPDASVFVELSDAQDSKDATKAAAAMVRMIKSGFPPEISDTINLKASELQDFTDRYMRFTGTNIPK